MEPVTHVLTGMCLARAGFNRKTAYAVAAMAIAAELPDIDMLWSLRGPVEGFTHHRGITHTFLGVPFEAALVVGGVWAWDRWRTSRLPAGMTAARASATADSSAAPRNDKQTEVPWRNDKQAGTSFGNDKRRVAGAAVPVRWGWLYGAVLVALLSHLLLDFTNNYGIRPFFPFDAHWYAWSIVFIFDPLLFAMLVIALVAPWLFGMIGAEVGARRPRFRGRGWAFAGLLGVVAWWGFRSVEHGLALDVAQGQMIAAPGVQGMVPAESFVDPTSQSRDRGHPGSAAGADGVPIATPVVSLQAERTLASPDPLNPFRWSAVTDFGPVYRQSEIDSWRGTLQADDILTPKPGHDAAVRAAEASPLGRAYLDWCPMPYIEEQAVPGGGSVITLGDPRFMGGWMAAHGHPALIGTVRENAQGRVTQQSLDERVEP